LKRAVPQSWGTSNGTFKTKKVGEITLSFVEYSLSKSVHLTPDIVEYDAGATAPLYDLIIGKQTLHDIGAVLDFKEKTITIDGILLPVRNIVSLCHTMVLAGNISRLWRVSLRPDAGVSDDRPVCHHPISQPFTMSDGLKIQVRYATYYGKILRYPT